MTKWRVLTISFAVVITGFTLFFGVDCESFVLIVFSIRLPNFLTALISGASLGLAGALAQIIFRNPLADPYILGVSSGSSAGIAIAFATGAYAAIGYSSIFLFAFFGGLVALGVIFSVFSLSRRKDTVILLLTGVIFGYISVSITSLLMSNMKGNVLYSLTEWLFGTTAFFDYKLLGIFAATLIVVFILSLMRSTTLDRMLLSDKKMISLGEDPDWNRRFFFLLIALMVSFSVSVSGIIGFLGLISPHIARKLFSSRASKLLPASAFIGALLLICAHLVTVMVHGIRIPVGITISIAGGVYFIYLLWRRDVNAF